jgi:alpha-L-glutamate ligase-like protein
MRKHLRWLFGAQRLRRRGILGMNRRNAEYILAHNPAAAIGLVDDKLRVHRLCAGIGVPTPDIFAVFDQISGVRRFSEQLGTRADFVIKPARGSGGRGVVVVAGRDHAGYRQSSGSRITLTAITNHLTDILSGMHSLGGQPDAAFIQQRVGLHPALTRIAVDGIPDVRIVLYRGEPAMAMLRLPTRESNGRANLHQGGLGVGVELHSGKTYHAVQANRRIRRHPNTGAALLGRCVPCWDSMLAMSRQVAAAVGLGYLGVDLVLDPQRGPLLLEANARAGLAIQHANGRGLLPVLKAIDERCARREFIDSRGSGGISADGVATIGAKSA